MARVQGLEKTAALAYFRTSSASDVGADKDSVVRQRMAVKAYASSAGIEIADEFHDAAVSGADPVETRPGFAAMLDRIDGNGVRMVLVEDASRFARSVVAAKLGCPAHDQAGRAGDHRQLTSVDDPRKDHAAAWWLVPLPSMRRAGSC